MDITAVNNREGCAFYMNDNRPRLPEKLACPGDRTSNHEAKWKNVGFSKLCINLLEHPRFLKLWGGGGGTL